MNRPNNIIFEAIAGSHAYGTSLPTSDIDRRGVYVTSLRDLYINQIKNYLADETQDTVFYEFSFFISLIEKQTPNILELLFSPLDCIVQLDQSFREIYEMKELFLSKRAVLSFAKFASTQIDKSKRVDKKINWENNRVKRKTLDNFCYVINEKGFSTPLLKWLENNSYSQEQFGLSSVTNARDLYKMYLGNNYKGIYGENSISLRLSDIPEGEIPIALISYNADAYSSHCKEYREYQTWLKERNEARYVDFYGHGQKIDGKNLLHSIRLLNMAKELLKEKTIRVRRNENEIKYLLQIRRGEIDLEKVYEKAKIDLSEIYSSINQSSLRDDIDKTLLKNLLYDYRKSFYS